MVVETQRAWRRVELRLAEIDRGPAVPATPHAIAGLIARLGANHAREEAWVAAVDEERVRAVARLAIGSAHQVSFSLPALLAVPLLAGASELVFVHTHPSGRLIPSAIDLALTRTIVAAANACGLLVADHLIVAPDGRHRSLREVELMAVHR